MLLPSVLIVAGLTITVASLNPQVVTNYATFYAGTITPGNATFALPAVDTGYLQINLTEGGCNLRLYPATDPEWVVFNSTGALPSTWIDCTSRGTTTTGNVRDLILLNDGSSAEPYNVTILAYSFETPYAWVALPGTGLALAGLLLLVPKIAIDRAMQMREHYEGKRKK